MRLARLLAALGVIWLSLCTFAVPPPLRVNRQSPTTARATTATAAPYTAYAVTFNGTSQSLSNNAPTVTDGSQGLLSVWIKIESSTSDGVAKNLIANGTGRVDIGRYSNNKIRFTLKSTAGFTILLMESSGTYTYASPGGWLHVLAGWDLGATPTAYLYVNEASVIAASPTVSTGTIDYDSSTTKWTIGCYTDGGYRFGYSMSEFFMAPVYVAPATAVHLFSSGGKPINLASAIAVTGTPWLYFPGNLSSGATAINSGSAGDFDIRNGPLTATTAP